MRTKRSDEKNEKKRMNRRSQGEKRRTGSLFFPLSKKIKSKK